MPDDPFNAAVVAAKLEVRVDSHEQRLGAINGSIDRMNTLLVNIQLAQERQEAAARTTAAVAKEMAARQVTTRTFILGVVTVLIALAALFVSVSA